MSSIRRRWFIGRPRRYLRQLPVSWVGLPESELDEHLEILPFQGAPVVLTPGGWSCILAAPQPAQKWQSERKARRGRR